MLPDKTAILGIDTSNYTTSVALIEAGTGTILADCRQLLRVKEGARGLRQSDALFQHVMNLPELMQQACSVPCSLAAIAASERPRSVKGSYMPCFLPGMNLGRSMAAGMQIPYYGFSHQEGHIAALLPGSGLSVERGFLSFHMSGGTCELLRVDCHGISIIGGSRDISFGQVLDRVGVHLGMAFPAGKEMDDIALHHSAAGLLGPVHCRNGWVHLTGLETACYRLLERGVSKEELISDLFLRIGETVLAICRDGQRSTGLNKTMLVGGVSTSRTLHHWLNEHGGEDIHISRSSLGRDNAVGIARLGESQWQSNR